MSPETSAQDATTEAPAPAVTATNLSLTGKRGLVYGPLDLNIAPGTLTLLQGPQGSGRTALLLTIAGRMRPDKASGGLLVLNHPLPKQSTEIQRRAAIAGFAGIDDLDGSVTVGDTLRERLGLLTPWFRRQPALTPRRYEQIAGPVFGDVPLPGLSTVVWDLDEPSALLLRITVALLQAPSLIVVDDLDQVHDAQARALIWQRLEALALGATGKPLTVIATLASANEPATIDWQGEPPAVIAVTRSASYAARTTTHALSEGN